MMAKAFFRAALKALAPALLALFACGAARSQESLKAAVGQKLRDLSVLERPGQKSVTFYGQNCYQSLWLGEKARGLLSEAAQKYLEQFEKKRLQKPKNGAGERFYSGAEALLEWGPRKDSMERSATAKIRFGYAIYGKNAFFLIKVPSQKSQAPAQSPAFESSEPASLLFTRAQLKSLLAALR